MNFVRSIMRYLPERISTEHLAIGRESKREWRPASLLAPVIDNVRLIRRARSGRFHCVQVNPSMNLPSLLRDGLFLLSLRWAGCNSVLVYFHGWNGRLARHVAARAYLRRPFRSLFGHARVICVLATEFKNELMAMGIPGDKVRVTSTMFDTDIYDGVERRRDDPRLRVLFLGRLVRQKGVFETLEAFARLHRAGLEADLVIAGDGPERDALIQRTIALGMREHVSFPGYLRGRAKGQAMLDADLFVFPTYYGEGCPVSLLEAMAAGLPIITGRAGGIPDVFVDGRNGVMLRDIRTEELTAHMSALLNDPERRARMAEHNRNVAWSRFRAEVVVDRLADLYREVTERP